MTVVFCILHSSENRGALIPVPSLFFKFLFWAKIVTAKSEKKKKNKKKEDLSAHTKSEEGVTKTF